MDVAQSVRKRLAGNPQEPLIEASGRWVKLGEIRALCDSFEELLADNGIEPGHAVGLIVRNRPGHVGVFASLVENERPVSMIYAFQSPGALARDIADVELAAVVASADDWDQQMIEAANISGTLGIAVEDNPPFALRVVTDPSGRPRKEHRRMPSFGVEILSSGTTGAPKRIFHRSEVLFRTLVGVSVMSSDADVRPLLVHWPLGGIGGAMMVIRALLTGAPIILQERFSVEGTVDAARRHHLRQVPVTPTMVRMLYDADVPRENFASLESFVGGAGPLDPDLQDKFEERYGVPILWGMGATEFCGSIASWTRELRDEFGDAKRGSSGRAYPGVDLLVRDVDTGERLPSGEVGKLAVRIPVIGPDWIETTDLVAIDEDGFIFHHGRSDGAIIRGGFKIIPEKLNETLQRHPGVQEVAVIGVPDERLGAIPVAIVVRRPGHEDLTTEDLADFARDRLPTPQLPARYHFLDKMPHTPSTKINLAELKKRFSNG